MAHPTEIKNLAQYGELCKAHPLIAIDFFATWCGPCRYISPHFDKEAATNPNVLFCKCDVDEAQDVAAKFEIEAMPTFAFVKNGQEIAGSRVVGANIDGLKANIAKLAAGQL